MTGQTSEKPVYAGYRVVDQGAWRTITCLACGKSAGPVIAHAIVTHRMLDGNELTHIVVNAHRCGPIGTPWAEPGPPGPGPAHARLLRSVTHDVLTAGVGLYAEDQEVIDAGIELVDALISQLHSARYGDVNELLGANLDELERRYAAADHFGPGDGGRAA